ncbi:hypothetical protein MYX78_13810, partial [Acidobacteria bacterium AH-259-G07]|nr:hypothetical protein [Acidobacteria bacterium AH-259-G07]
ISHLRSRCFPYANKSGQTGPEPSRPSRLGGSLTPGKNSNRKDAKNAKGDAILPRSIFSVQL